MGTETATEQPPFATRYLLAEYVDGGVIVDLASGNYYRVNRTAAVVCKALRASTDRAGIELSVANEIGIDLPEAAKVVQAVIAELDGPRFRGEIQGSYHFYPMATGYELRHGEIRVLEVDEGGSRIRIPEHAPKVPAAQLELYVRALALKLLFQKGVTALHASSCMVAGNLVAFAGVSGAGKTTTARAFAAAGAELISEELLVIAPGTEGYRVLTTSEPVVFDWCRAVASQLVREPEYVNTMGQLVSDLATGPTEPLSRLTFLDSVRRSGVDFTTRSLSGAEALAELLRHEFLGAAGTEAWSRFFGAAVTLVDRVRMYEGWSPEGVEHLQAAAERYIVRTVS